MYVPRHFATDELIAARELLAIAPLAQLVSMSPDGLIASAAPMLLVETEGELRLHGHLARANDHWKTVDTTVETLAIITGPDAYVSPNSYPSKAATHQVVPTWNYESVHARGPLTIHDDANWVLDLVTRLTTTHEQSQDVPWKVSDAPADYIATRLKGIVGIEIVITSLEAKAKLSQDKTPEDSEGVIACLKNGNANEQHVANRMTNGDRPH